VLRGLKNVRNCPSGRPWVSDESVSECRHLAWKTKGTSMAKILCVLYDDPIGGYPTGYPRDDLPRIERYPDGQTLPTPSAIDFQPGQLLGSVSGELGLRKFLEAAGHQLVVTSDKDGADSRFERELGDADVVISQPFWPAYMTAERFAKAKNLKMVVTAGIGSDHTDLQAAAERGVTVAEVTYCNSISVSEHVVMMILALARNYLPSWEVVKAGGWDIADCAARSYDIEGMHVGTVAAGRIGSAVLRRLKPFDVHLHYTDRYRLPLEVERELGATFHESAAEMVPLCDVVTINCPLHPETENLFNAAMIARMKRGAYLVNTARRGGGGAEKRSARGLCWRRLVPTACAERPSMADHVASWDDSAHFRDLPVGAGPLCGGCPRNPRMLRRGAADPR